MSTKPCRKCRREVSTSASNCQNCGATTGKLTRAIKAAMVAGAAIFITNTSIQLYKEQARNKKASSDRYQQSSAQEESKTKRGWVYTEEPDAMGRGTIKIASLKSENTIEFERPYARPQHATLTVRSHPSFGVDAIISIERGQFICQTASCFTAARFGKLKPTKIEMQRPEDHSSTALFFSDSKDFIAKLKKSDHLMVEATFFQEGTRVMSFDTKGLNW